MAQQTLGLGAAPNDGTGDDLRAAGDKINDNFTELYGFANDPEAAALRGLTSAADKLPYFTGSGTAGVADFTAAGRSMVGAADAAAQRALLRNFAMVKRAAALTAQNWTAGGIISWDAEVTDAGGWHDNSTNPTRITVPAGVTVVEVGCSIGLTNVTANDGVTVSILKGGVTYDGRPSMAASTSSTSPRINIASGPLAVTPGEYFEVQVTVATDTSVDLTTAVSNFWAKAAV